MTAGGIQETGCGEGDYPPAAEGSCLTCADLAITAKVLRLLPDAMALVEVGEATETVSVALIRAQVGDAILVHAREAIAVVGR